MRIFVSGANGMIGTELVAMLKEDGHDIRQMWRYNADRGLLAPPDVVWGDLKDGNFAPDMLWFNPEVIIHLGALASNVISNKYPAEAMQTNAVGTARMIDAAKQVKSLKAFVLASSSEVYGVPQETALTEDSPLLALGPYHASKIAAEQAVRGSGLPFIIMRPFNTFGRASHGSAVAVADKWILKGLKGESIPLGGSSTIRDFVFRSDHAGAYRAVVEGLNRQIPFSGETFNVTNGEPTSLRALFDIIQRYIPELKGTDDNYARAGDIPVLHGDASRIKHVLGWEAKYSVRAGVLEAVMEWRAALEPR